MGKIVEGNSWVDIVLEVIPEHKSEEPYLYFKSKKETVAAIVFDVNTQEYVFRVEGSLPSNFTPAPKILSETMESGEVPEQALVRGIKEEMGLDIDSSNFCYLGKLNGTYEGTHKYYLYIVLVESYNISSDFSGDGSGGEKNSTNVKMPVGQIVVEDWLWLTAYGKFRNQLDNLNPDVLNLFSQYFGASYVDLGMIL